jgi:hypothetical protein
MLDILLTWIVIAFPLIFAVAVEVVSKKERDTATWRLSIILLGVVLSILTVLQIVRADRNVRIDKEGHSKNHKKHHIGAESSVK